jgi:hypothetical protein
MRMTLMQAFMTMIGLRHPECHIPKVMVDRDVAEAGKRNATAFRQMNRTTMRSIMASSETSEAVHGVLDRLEKKKGSG